MFHFKQFSLKDDRCGMKIGTDGVLLGAWVDIQDTSYILDIGTGCGLIAIMMAQRTVISHAHIDAVEVDIDAALQARENVKRSPWNSRICVVHQSIQSFVQTHRKKYDLIVCNPPFFDQSTPTKNRKRHIARYTDALPFDTLIDLSQMLLTPQDRLNLILPYGRRNQFLALAEEKKFYVKREQCVHPNTNKEAHRILLCLSKESIKPTVYNSPLYIETARHAYTEGYAHLTKPFYLYM